MSNISYHQLVAYEGFVLAFGFLGVFGPLDRCGKQFEDIIGKL